MDNGTPRQQIAERIKNATNILVTVSRDPSVDELSAALALTLMLNKMEKHATAVFSGKVPPAITFLEPNKTFENTVDSLRDFIIALDKNKADRLRYKVEDDVVRIFITPYRTTITEKDLQFSQGDFNVELIVALGVERREDLDTAVTAHGRILHDAATVTLNTKEDKNSLGVVDWQEADASSLCEMLVSLDELLGSKVDEQIATALLTGVVAATQRFKNVHTSPRVMTMAAQLMAAGANQRLIASKLEEAQEIPKVEHPAKDGTTKLDEGKSKKIEKVEKKPDGEMSISHEEGAAKTGPKPKQEKAPTQPKKETSPEVTTEAPAQPPKSSSPDESSVAKASKELDEAIAKASSPKGAASSDLAADLKKDLDTASKELDAAASQKPPANPLEPSEPQIKTQGWRDQEITPPSMGGTLNATTEDAEEAKRQEEADNRNHTILTHDKPMGQPENVPAPFNSYAAEVSRSEPPSVDPFGQHAPGQAPILPPSAPKPPETIADIEASHTQPGQPAETQARRAVEDALNAMPFDPAHRPVDSLNAEPLSLPHIEHTEPQPPQFTPPEQTNQPAAPSITPAPPVGGVPLPPPPPMPDFSSLPPLPPAPQMPTAAPPSFDTNVNAEPIQPPAETSVSTPAPQNPSPAAPPLPPMAPPVTPPQAATDDPSQFKIPGQ
jgi:hypothetical protein